MALKCEVCGKKTVYGNQQLHRHSRWRFRAPKTKRTWVPNIRSLTLKQEEKTKTLNICMSCYKRYQKDGVSFLVKKKVKGVKPVSVK